MEKLELVPKFADSLTIYNGLFSTNSSSLNPVNDQQWVNLPPFYFNQNRYSNELTGLIHIPGRE